MKTHFDFYEIVTVVSKNPDHANIHGKLGVVRGKSKNEKTGSWSYGVAIYDLEGVVFHLNESEIKSMGKKVDSSEFCTGESAKVSVNPRTGEGH